MPELSQPPRSRGLHGISRIFPDLQEDLLLNLFHKGAKAQWTAPDRPTYVVIDSTKVPELLTAVVAAICWLALRSPAIFFGTSFSL